MTEDERTAAVAAKLVAIMDSVADMVRPNMVSRKGESRGFIDGYLAALDDVTSLMRTAFARGANQDRQR